eukprot:12717675-Alexandrium_andersonii.AAC.1
MLADDLMVGTAADADVLPAVAAQQQSDLVRLTFDYLTAMGARVSHEKCVTVCSSARVRALLKRQQVEGH